jgi:hypothetical protein
MLLSGFLAKPCLTDETSALKSQAVLTVEVTNGTENGATVENDLVIVRIYEEGQLLRALDGNVNTDGKAVFDDVPTGDRVIAVVRARHQDMMFNGRPVVLRPAADELVARVQVFDVSDDNSKLSVEIHHFMITAQSELLEITEFMQLKNSSDMAVSSKERDSQDRTIVLEIVLPKGFKNLTASSYFEESALVVTEEGFYDTMAVPPGEYEVTFSYTLDITSNAMDIVKKISLPTSSFVLFAELGQAELQGLGHAEQQLLRKDGAQMKYYKYTDLAPAEEVVFQITGFNVDASGLATWMILGAVFSAVVVLAILRLRPEKK